MPTAAMIAVTALNTNTKPMPPNCAAPNAPIDGPSSSPPICAAPYSPNASPRRSGRRRIGQEAAGRRVVDRRPEPGAARSTMNATGPVQTSGSAPNTPVATRPMTISGTRAVRSASQPKIGSLTSRAAARRR